ncbi:MAG: response regulator transcription factor [Candidatus Thiodiazotropha sp. (ex Cardiolucina cf. quadrata)]|nr:response regulator transcription factor [Candidatus Thiodiazotropha sp. (ex Cardiolucina cf. quadrata)]
MLVDDHAVVREGYRRLIEKHEDMIVVAEAADGSKAYQEYKRHKPDVVVLDLSMPGKGGIEVIRQLRQWHDAARILVFTMHQNAAYAIQAFQAGAKGYITKSSEPEALVSAIHEIFNGQRAISPDITRELAIARIEDESTFLDSLTAREFEIFRMIANASTIAEIAATLNLSTKTVSNYHYLIKSKLGVSSDIELAHLATRMRIVDPDKLQPGD